MSDIVIYGKGKTGIALGEMLQKQGKNAVFVDDKAGVGDFSADDIDLSEYEALLVSPGVKPCSPLIVRAKREGVPVCGELEYCQKLCKAKCVSVTGTNGKTTVTELIHHIFSRCGVSDFILGNGGIPFATSALALSETDVAVLESSSFQLADCVDFSPYISVFVSLAPDHIDYHGSYSEYVAAKCNNFLHQDKGCFAVFNADEAEVLNLAADSPCYTYFYSVSNKNANCYMDGNDVVVDTGNCSVRVRSVFCARQLLHNRSNILAAVLAAVLYGLPAADCVAAAESFCFLPHRMDCFERFNGVEFIDDSKATNVHATLAALKCCKGKRTALILGGSDKGYGFDDVFADIGADVEFVAVIGQTSDKILQSAKRYGFSNIRRCGNLEEAVRLCYDFLKKKGGVLLMSNACASFDMFSGYAARGDAFQQCVRELIRA